MRRYAVTISVMLGLALALSVPVQAAQRELHIHEEALAQMPPGQIRHIMPQNWVRRSQIKVIGTFAEDGIEQQRVMNVVTREEQQGENSYLIVESQEDTGNLVGMEIRFQVNESARPKSCFGFDCLSK